MIISKFMTQTDSGEIKSSGHPFARISLILGLIGPATFLLLLLILKIGSFGGQNTSGMGGLGLASLFVFVIVIILLLSFPLGIAAIFFGVHAFAIAKKANISKTASIVGIIIGLVDVLASILLFFLTVLPR